MVTAVVWLVTGYWVRWWVARHKRPSVARLHSIEYTSGQVTATARALPSLGEPAPVPAAKHSMLLPLSMLPYPDQQVLREVLGRLDPARGEDDGA